ncbi:MAG: DNA gyrase/topoisomerase IV subunit A [Chitinophagia bacterium]|nr:DNA gyrase/topoisomerase IV subunit A [Chitinophagia bacterium]
MSDNNSEFSGQQAVVIGDMYQSWFLDYASYVILERAVPAIEDGMKPVQRRILHSMREMDDGRFNKVANVIGQTMQYHPHGDASITDAMVGLGQKELLIETQGNWGDVRTGDPAAAARYIEARLSKFALEVAFNPKTTRWQLSYDGRKNEPITLPMKFPLLLAQGTDGIAVGLSTKILPHNFCELIDAAIKHLRNQPFELYPDFMHGGGMVDVTAYNDGGRGGKVRVRAKIVEADKKTLLIKSVPYGITTSQLVDSILKANDTGKIKIKSVTDNTAKDVELTVALPPGVDTDQTIDALYAFTDCEISISPNACVVVDDKPHFLCVSDLLKHSVNHTRQLLLKELELKLGELNNDWHYSSLEKIFIENRIYRDIEEETTWQGVLTAIDKGLEPFKQLFRRVITVEDITRLTEIRIKRISRFDSFKADEHIAKLEAEIKEVKRKLNELVETCIDYFKELKRKYGKDRERKTELRQFDTVEASKVAIANVKLFVNRAEGFAGTGLKRDEGEWVCECSDIDDIIVFRRDGKMLVKRVEQKAFFGKDIIHIAVWKKDDKRTIYNMIYSDGKKNGAMMKRFAVTAITRDKEYDLTKGTPGSEVLHFTANPNGEAEVVTIHLRAQERLRKLKYDVNFADLAIKGRDAVGNVVSKFPVKRVELRQAGISTLGARKIWLDESVMRLNEEGHGRFLGDFNAEDKILVVVKSGIYKLIAPDLSTHFDEGTLIVERWIKEKPLSAVYFDGDKQTWFVKRFLIEDSRGPVTFIGEHANSKLGIATLLHHPVVYVRFDKRNKIAKNKMDESIGLRDFIAVKGLKAIGNKLTNYPVLNIELLEPDQQMEEQSENLLQDLIAAKQPRQGAFDIDNEDFIPQDPSEIEFEIEGLEEDMARFKAMREASKGEASPEPPKPKGKTTPGTQGSLF